MIIKFLRILMLVIPYFAFGQNEKGFEPLDNPAEVKEGVANLASRTNTLKASFSQKKFVSILSQAIESKGEMLFEKPKNLKWSYSTPYEYTIVFFENEIVINDEGKRSSFDISSSKTFMEINEVIINSVSGNILQEDQFDISYSESASEYLAKLKPKAEQMATYVSVIDVYLDKQDFSVTRIKLVEKGQDYTLIDFHDKQINVHIADGAFDIK